MKSFSLASIVLLSAFLVTCSDKDPDDFPEPRGGSMEISMVHEVNGAPLQLGEYLYQNDAGDSFQVTFLQYYISNFEFYSQQTGWKKVDHYQFVRVKDSLTTSFLLEDLPFGEYDSVRFFIGIDSAANHDIDKLDQLDPGYGMIWSWNSGYIFYMFEGKFINDNNMALPFAYHIGGDEYLMRYQVPISAKKVLSKDKTKASLAVHLDLGEMFQSPHEINLNQVPLVSHSFDEPALTTKLVENMFNACTAK